MTASKELMDYNKREAIIAAKQALSVLRQIPRPQPEWTETALMKSFALLSLIADWQDLENEFRNPDANHSV